MDERPNPLPYARPMPGVDRPPMYCLVLTIMASGFLILLGLGGLVGFFAGLAGNFSPAMSLWLVLGPIFLVVGGRSMMQTVHFLRGGTYEGDWRRWMFGVPEGRD